MNKWLAYQENPGPTPYSFLAQAYYGLEDYKNIIVNAQKAIDIAQEQGLEVKENWWLLLRLAYFELGDMKKVGEVLETLAVNYDKPEYWLQLAGVYSELGEEKKQLAAMEVAYRRGYITTENNLQNLAQLYLYHEVPIKAAWVIEKGLKDGIIEKSAKIHELLGQAYLNAQEMEKAKKPLELAAEEKDDGDIWMRVGQVYAQLEQWKQAIDPLQKAIDSKDLKEPGYAYMLLGMANFYTDQFDKAKKAFHKAREFKYTQKSARQWIRFVDEEVKRRKQLTAYYGGGQQSCEALPAGLCQRLVGDAGAERASSHAGYATGAGTVPCRQPPRIHRPRPRLGQRDNGIHAERNELFPALEPVFEPPVTASVRG